MSTSPDQPSSTPTTARETRLALRDFALGLPGAYEDHPWGEIVVKVNKKVFVFLSVEPTKEEGLRFSVKLPHSGPDVLTLPFAEPSGYGLGKHGWVTFQFLPAEQPPMDILSSWIGESYRAIAPKRLVAEFDQPKSRAS